jgi:hypothetical protein
MNNLNICLTTMRARSLALAIVGLAFSTLPFSEALAAGNTSAQEYGDAVYRKLTSTSWLGLNYNHAGLFAGQSAGVKRCIEADTLTGDTTKDNSFSSSFTGYGSDYYGAFTLSRLLKNRLFFGRRHVDDAFTSSDV